MAPAQNATYIGPSKYHYHKASLLTIIFGLIIIIAFFGNFLVCVAILGNRRLRKHENLFLLSLAVSDMMVAALVMSFAAINDIEQRWLFGDYCKIWMSFDVMCCSASILNLSAISLDRYWHVRSPMTYMETITRTKTLIVIAAIWILSASISFIPINLGWHIANDTTVHKFAITQMDTQCILDLSPAYAVFSTAISFFLPSVIMIAAYLRMYCFAQRHVKALRDQHRSIERLLADGLQPESLEHMEDHRKRLSHSIETWLQDHKARVTVGIIVGVFLACWLPFFSVNIIQALCNCISISVFNTVTWIGYANSMSNPIIYSVFSQDFRYAFKEICKLRCKA